MGFIEVRPDVRDRRYKTVHLTPKGRAFLDQLNIAP
jgi:DNA-binding MarR family transcriptional regulator